MQNIKSRNRLREFLNRTILYGPYGTGIPTFPNPLTRSKIAAAISVQLETKENQLRRSRKSQPFFNQRIFASIKESLQVDASLKIFKS